MPFLWLAGFGAVILLVRRTWKASRKRRAQVTPDAEPATEMPEDGI